VDGPSSYAFERFNELRSGAPSHIKQDRISGAVQLLGMLLLGNFAIGSGLWSLFILTIGISFLVATNRYVHLICGKKILASIHE